jgi:hypothetical protein
MEGVLTMGFFKQLTKVVTRAATLPVAVVKDAATLGGVIDDSGEVMTLEVAKKVVEDIMNLHDSVDED